VRRESVCVRVRERESGVWRVKMKVRNKESERVFVCVSTREREREYIISEIEKYIYGE
jgi:hypothetical protein